MADLPVTEPYLKMIFFVISLVNLNDTIITEPSRNETGAISVSESDQPTKSYSLKKNGVYAWQ
jgi:hypothetical protein